MTRVSLRRRPILLTLAAIVALAATLRLALLRQDSTFQRTDEVMFLLNAMNLHALVAPTSLGDAARQAFWTLAFPWGYPVVVFLWSVLEVYGIIGLPITEMSAVAPFALLGAVGTVLLFILGARLFSPAVGLAAAAALAVFPAHVAQSRTIAAWILAADLMMLVVIRLIAYLETRKSRDAWLLSLALALYLPSDNLAPGIVLLMFLVPFVQTRGGPATRLGVVWRLWMRREVLVLPALTMVPLVAAHLVFVATGRTTYGFIGHYFLGKARPGIHVAEVIRGLVENGGAAMTVLIAIGAVRGLVALARRDAGLVPALWAAVFVVPTALLVNPAGTVMRAYLTPLLLPLLLLGAAGIEDAARAAATRAPRLAPALAVTAGAIVIAWTLATIPPRVYDTDFVGFHHHPIGLWGGEIYGNDGAKTAGYFIRQQTPPAAVVLSDLRLFIGKYYFNRRTLTASAGADGADILAVTAGGRAHAEAGGWQQAATVTHDGREVFYVYSRAPRVPVRLAAEEFDRRFDREYGHVGTLRYPVVWGDE